MIAFMKKRRRWSNERCPNQQVKSTVRHLVVRNGVRSGVKQYRCITCSERWSAITEKCPYRQSNSRKPHRVVRNGVRSGVQQYRCKTCRRQWSTRRRPLFSGKRQANEKKIVIALRLKTRGVPIQGIASLLSVKPDTVSAWIAWAQPLLERSQSGGHRSELVGLIEPGFKDEIVMDYFDPTHWDWRSEARESRVALGRDVRRLLGSLKIRFRISKTGKITVPKLQRARSTRTCSRRSPSGQPPKKLTTRLEAAARCVSNKLLATR
jgi:transposase-like protein